MSWCSVCGVDFYNLFWFEYCFCLCGTCRHLYCVCVAQAIGWVVKPCQKMPSNEHTFQIQICCNWVGSNFCARLKYRRVEPRGLEVWRCHWRRKVIWFSRRVQITGKIIGGILSVKDLTHSIPSSDMNHVWLGRWALCFPSAQIHRWEHGRPACHTWIHAHLPLLHPGIDIFYHGWPKQ